MWDFIQDFAIRIAVIIALFLFLIQIVKLIGRIWKSALVQAFVAFVKKSSVRFARINPFFNWIVRVIVRAGDLMEIAFKGFHQITGEDTLEEAGSKIRANFLRGLVYDVADYNLAIICAIMVSQLNDWDWSFAMIFLATWMFDIVCCVISIVGCEKSSQDLTLGLAHRNAFEAVSIASRLGGHLYKIIQHPMAVIWDGPEQLVYFYKKELHTWTRVGVTVVSLTLLQGLFWTWIYSLGHDHVIARIVEWF